MTLARISTDREKEYELLNFTDDAEYILRDAASNVRAFEVSSPRELVEVKCDVCGRWSAGAGQAPLNIGWACQGGYCLGQESAA
jgi:hypothetical protein